jgi:ketosteroid isomerase-like protein
MLRAVADRDATALTQLATEDVVFEPASTDVAERHPYHGHDGLRQYLADLDRDWDEFDISISEVRQGPRCAVALGRVYARAGGAIADGPAAFVFELREGRVCWAKTYRDRAEALRRAGLE